MFYTKLSEVYQHVFPAQGKLALLDQHFKPQSNLLDMGCSDGRVALGMATLGHKVEAADLSEDMIATALGVSQGQSLFQVKEVNMLETSAHYPANYFDGVYCIGNTLVHLNQQDQVAQAIQSFQTVLKEDGVLILQILNYEKVIKDQITTLPLIDNDYVRFERAYDLGDNTKGDVNDALITFKTKLTIKETGISTEESTTLMPLKKDQLANLLRSNGFTDLEWFGNYDGKPFANEDLTLIVVAKKR